jgi:hypothetical protein
MTQVAAFVEEMNHAGADWQLIVYGGAMHGFTHEAGSQIPGVAYHAITDARSSSAIQSFFVELFCQDSNMARRVTDKSWQTWKISWPIACDLCSQDILSPMSRFRRYRGHQLLCEFGPPRLHLFAKEIVYESPEKGRGHH